MKVLLEKEEIRLPQVFDGTSSRVSEFVEECRKYMEKKMKKEKMEDKIYWVISYVQEGSTDEWKEKKVDEIFKDRWKDRNIEEILKEIEREFGKDKKIEEDIGKGMDSFWNAVKEKKMMKKEEKPIVMVMMPKKANGKKRR